MLALDLKFKSEALVNKAFIENVLRISKNGGYHLESSLGDNVSLVDDSLSLTVCYTKLKNLITLIESSPDNVKFTLSFSKDSFTELNSNKHISYLTKGNQIGAQIVGIETDGITEENVIFAGLSNLNVIDILTVLDSESPWNRFKSLFKWFKNHEPKIEGDYAPITLSGSNEVKVQKASIVSVLPDGTLANL
jgi:hypothetical protein